MKPLNSLQRPQACLLSGGTRHVLLLATTSSQFSLAHLKAINSKSLRLTGARSENTGWRSACVAACMLADIRYRLQSSL